MKDISAQTTSHREHTQTPVSPVGGSLIVYCHHCEERQLVPSSRIESKHRTSEGVIGYVRCQGGHVVIHSFAQAYAKPKPPASVIALRARQAAAQMATEHGACVAGPNREIVSRPA